MSLGIGQVAMCDCPACSSKVAHKAKTCPMCGCKKPSRGQLVTYSRKEGEPLLGTLDKISLILVAAVVILMTINFTILA